MRFAAVVVAFTWLLTGVLAVKRQDFKTCAQSGFCRRLRDLPTSESTSPYSIDRGTASWDASTGVWRAAIASSIWPEVSFELQVSVTEAGLARVRVDELAGLRQRYNETGAWALLQEPKVSKNVAVKAEQDAAVLSWEVNGSSRQAKVTFSPLKVELLRDGQVHVAFNEQNLFHMEHFRVKKVGEEVQDTPLTIVDGALNQKREEFKPFMSEDGAWEETFGGKTDSKPKGPEAVSWDVTFPGYQHVFGIPQHASPLSLKTTRGGDNAYTDPYRLYNADVFEYLPDSEMSIYGSIPFMHAHKAGSTVAIFSLVGSETWIDITKSSASTHTHWMSESGILDLIVFLGPTDKEIFEQYGQLTGTTAMPQMFAIGHHQCRWNYLNEEDVAEVSRKFDEFDIPMDVIWLDIEYAEDHKYFVWNKDTFADPISMQEDLAARGRQLVAIVDPHIKRVDDLYVYKEAQNLDILYKQADGKSEFEGWCWTGSSAWTDYFNPKSWDWWIGLFKFDKFKGSARNLFVWNDMNEPSIFNGPEITAPKDVVHYGGWEHRDVHNINGMLFHNLTSQALIEREDYPRRPFVLSRSFFAGSQRFGAIWTGDNLGTWEHLAVSVPMILSNSIGGMTFNGADVGGFFGNPEPEMLVRWYQCGAFHPFFRAHAHIDTKRREPYLFDEPIRGYLRDAIRLRYSLLPAWYTAFWHASLSGLPIVRPQYYMFPGDEEGFTVDDQYFVGDSGLLVRPVVKEGATDASVYLGDDQPYYDYLDHTVYTRSSKKNARVTVPAPLEKLPLFQRGGSILTRRDLIRRAAPLMWRDPITLVVALDKSGTNATGDLYMDDGDSYNYQSGEFVWRGFELASAGTGGKSKSQRNLVLSNKDLVSIYTGPSAEFAKAASLYKADNKFAQSIAQVNVDEVIIVGLAVEPTCISVLGSSEGLGYEWTEGVSHKAGSKKNGQTASVLRIKAAGLPVTKDWTLSIAFDAASTCTARPSVDYLKTLESPQCSEPGMFQCQNKGHIPSCILVSRVNDGICDPECCDGSDEQDGKVSCPNRCNEVGAAYRKKTEEEARVQRVGAKVREEWSKVGLKEKRKVKKSIARLETELVALREKEQALRVLLERVEKSEASDIERKKGTQLYARLKEHQAYLSSLRKHRAYLISQVDDLSALLADLKKSFNPNYQDMAVLGAVRAFDEWRRKNGYEVTEGQAIHAEDGALTKEEVVPAEVDFDEVSDEDIQKMEEQDILGLMASLDPTSPAQETANVLFSIQNYLPDGLRPHYDSFRSRLLNILSDYGVIPKSTVENLDRPDIVHARSAHSSAQSAVSDASTKLSNEQAALDRDWGPAWEWKKVEGECIEKNTGEYTYELCWFGSVKQKANKSGHGTTTLGKFKRWEEEEEGEERYLTQYYLDGQRCWNGPDRSAIVELSCGTSNAILSVTEAEKCTYVIKVQTPGVCKTPTSEGESIHSEL